MKFVRNAEEELRAAGAQDFPTQRRADLQSSVEDETEPEAREVWAKFLDIIKSNVSELKLNTYFRPIKPRSFRNNNLLVAVPNQGFFEMLISRFGDKIMAAASAVLGKDGRLFYEIDPSIKPQAFAEVALERTESDLYTEYEPDVHRGTVIRELSAKTISQSKSAGSESSRYCRLDPNYTFENFVRGKSNELAVAAAISISNSPAKQYNPLMIYGGVGLGKTHLMQAIANHVLTHKTYPQFSHSDKPHLMYISSEQFTSNFIHSIQAKTVHEFERFFKSLDILIVDDIQFFQGKESTQDSFFQIFNSLYHLNKQIVLSCDKPPGELEGLESRLNSRFQWGLVVDIMPPDLETRIAILNKKCELEDLSVDYDVLEFVALNIKDNIRSLEGCLKTMMFEAALARAPIDIDIAKRAVRKYTSPSQRSRSSVDIGLIITLTARCFNVDESLLRMKTKRQEVVTARHTAMFLARELTGCSLQTIGSHFGGRNHASVIHACKCIENAINDDKEFAEKIQSLREDILTT